MPRVSLALSYAAVGTACAGFGSVLVTAPDAPWPNGGGWFAAVAGAVHFGLVASLTLGLRRCRALLSLGALAAGGATATLVSLHQGARAASLEVFGLGVLGSMPVACAGLILATLDRRLPRARNGSLAAGCGEGAVLAAGAALIALGGLVAACIDVRAAELARRTSAVAAVVAIAAVVAFEGRRGRFAEPATDAARGSCDLGIGDGETLALRSVGPYRRATWERTRGDRDATLRAIDAARNLAGIAVLSAAVAALLCQWVGLAPLIASCARVCGVAD
jgi:hypothetical protein